MSLSDIDFTRDIRYQEGLVEGRRRAKLVGKMEAKRETVLGLLKEGFEFSVIQRITGLELYQIQELATEVPKK